jgi:hypothetical protein
MFYKGLLFISKPFLLPLLSFEKHVYDAKNTGSDFSKNDVGGYADADRDFLKDSLRL